VHAEIPSAGNQKAEQHFQENSDRLVLAETLQKQQHADDGRRYVGGRFAEVGEELAVKATREIQRFVDLRSKNAATVISAPKTATPTASSIQAFFVSFTIINPLFGYFLHSSTLKRLFQHFLKNVLIFVHYLIKCLIIARAADFKKQKIKSNFGHCASSGLYKKIWD